MTPILTFFYKTPENNDQHVNLGLSKKETCLRGRGRGRSAKIMNFL